MMNLSPRQIEIFLAVAGTLNFSEAARLCHLSQPALSANIQRLEELVGARLFDRHTRKVALTAVGQEFLTVAEALAQSMDRALARVRDFASGKRGRIVVAAAPSMAASFVPAVIAAFTARHPLVDIELHDELSELCVQMVRSGTADVALAPHRTGADDLAQTELFRDPLVVVCPAGHPLARRTQVRWREVQAYAHIVMARSGSIRQLIDAEYSRHGVVLAPAFEVTHVGTLLGLIAAGLGVGELPLSLAQNLEPSGLVCRPISNASAYRTICAITSRRSSPAPPMQAFVALCRSLARERAAA